MRYKLAIFDMDGTILNTLEDLTDATNYSLRENGYPVRTIEEVRKFVGNGIRKLIERALPIGSSEEEADKVFDTFTEYYAKHCADKTCEYPGISALIKDLRSKGMKTAVVSNKVDFAVQELCEQYFDGLFDYAVGDRADLRKKPYPDSVNYVLDKLETDRKNAVYIGDSEVDYETAVNSNMDVIMVTWGFRDPLDISKRGAKVFADTSEQLEALILGE